MSDPWYADKIPLGPGLIHRHGKIEADFTHPKNQGRAGPQGAKGDTGAAGADGAGGADGVDGAAGPQGFTGPAGPTGPSGSTTLPPYTAADAGKQLTVDSSGALYWAASGVLPPLAYDTATAYDTDRTYEGI